MSRFGLGFFWGWPPPVPRIIRFLSPAMAEKRSLAAAVLPASSGSGPGKRPGQRTTSSPGSERKGKYELETPGQGQVPGGTFSQRISREMREDPCPHLPARGRVRGERARPYRHRDRFRADKGEAG